MKAFFRIVILLVVVMLATAVSAPAQLLETTIDTLSVPGRSAWEDGHLSLLSMDRAIVGGRTLALGGAGLAMTGGPEHFALNPASLLGLESAELESEINIYSGGAGVNSSPQSLKVGPDDFLDASNYRIRPREDLNYNSFSFGMPVVLLGKHAALGASYRRVARTGSPDETRVELQGTVTREAEATFGLGDLPTEGLDAISFSVAREITGFLDLGVNFNWQSGVLKREKDIGLAVFGFEIFSANSTFQQDVSSFNIDLGGRMDLGRINLGGVAYLGHDVKFKGAKTRGNFAPDPQLPNRIAFYEGRPLDNTLSVPTMIGLGSAIELSENLTVVADVWFRPWDKSMITRTALDAVVSFEDPSDSSTYRFALIPNPNGDTETFSARLNDTNSIRFGVEYFLSKSEDFELPVRFGYRRENLTLNNIRLPDSINPESPTRIADSYGDLVNAYFNDQGNPGLEAQLKEFAEFNNLPFRGDPVKATTMSLGIGVRVQKFSADFAVERVGYDIDRFFLQDFDPLLNPVGSVAKESRGLINLSLTTRMRF